MIEDDAWKLLWRKRSIRLFLLITTYLVVLLSSLFKCTKYSDDVESVLISMIIITVNYYGTSIIYFTN